MGDAAAVGQRWDAEAYGRSGRFVADLAGGVVELLGARAGERILDVGCGDGALTERLAGLGAVMTGVDVSEAMVAAARRRAEASPTPFRVEPCPAEELKYAGEFDAVFSNAALHWIPRERQGRALAGIFRALRPGGRLVVEMGGMGNIAAIRTALRAVLGTMGVDSEAAAGSFFASPGEYRGMLEAAGFTVETIGLYPRPTALPGGADGMAVWLRTFRNGVFEGLAEGERAGALERTVEMLRPILCGADGEWTADYVRLRFRAVRG